MGPHAVTLQVSDGTTTGTQSFTVTVANTNDAPVITSTPTASMAENTTAALTLASTDADAGDSAIYSIAGGTDAALFSINAASGELALDAVADFERPADSDRNNVYDVTVRVTDGAGTIDSLALAITILDANERPEAAATDIVASSRYSGVIGRIDMQDPDTGDLVRATIIGGTAPDAFRIDQNTGEIRRNADVLTQPGTYLLTVRVSDAQGAFTDIVLPIRLLDDAPLPGAAMPQPPDNRPSPPTGSDSSTSFDGVSRPDGSDGVGSSDTGNGDETPAPSESPSGTSDDRLEASAEGDLVPKTPPLTSGNAYAISGSNEPVRVSPPVRGAASASDTDTDAEGPASVPEGSADANVATDDSRGIDDADAFTLYSPDGALAPQVREAIDRLADDLEEDAFTADAESETFLTVGTITSVSLTAGFVTWLLNAGYLAATAASTAPLWRRFDPIPVLGDVSDDDPEDDRTEDAA